MSECDSIIEFEETWMMKLIMYNLKEHHWLNNFYYIRHIEGSGDLKCKQGKRTLVVKYCPTLTHVWQSILLRIITCLRKSFSKEVRHVLMFC
ncbi:hypothetical protein H5410_045729 [Solanum commersonii]|uniref:Uncharacterized protein n=1 Tax=Solanum commersonii TaxID=4109 RepID=A0A9J5XCH2_SOLCO|nr:hypothetical protein H5410_045729 [Solanum commersonii]